MKHFLGQGKVREFWFELGKLEKKTDKSQGKVREFQHFLKIEMAEAVYFICSIINLQNWPHSFLNDCLIMSPHHGGVGTYCF